MPLWRKFFVFYKKINQKNNRVNPFDPSEGGD